jgi:hypothetical protein
LQQPIAYIQRRYACSALYRPEAEPPTTTANVEHRETLQRNAPEELIEHDLKAPLDIVRVADCVKLIGDRIVKVQLLIFCHLGGAPRRVSRSRSAATVAVTGALPSYAQTQ